MKSITWNTFLPSTIGMVFGLSIILIFTTPARAQTQNLTFESKAGRVWGRHRRGSREKKGPLQKRKVAWNHREGKESARVRSSPG